MNIKQAKEIGISRVLSAFGYEPVKVMPNGEQWFLSPFRDENTPSLHVSPSDRGFYDFGDSGGFGGDVIELVKRLKSVDTAGALDILRTTFGQRPAPARPAAPQQPALPLYQYDAPAPPIGAGGSVGSSGG